MRFSIAYQQSGDTIEFETINNDVANFLVWFVDQLDSTLSNIFKCDRVIDHKIAIQALHDALTDVNTFIIPFLDEKFETRIDLKDYSNNHFLNKMHAIWGIGHTAIYNKELKTIQYAGTEYMTMIDQVNNIPIKDLQVNELEVSELLDYFEYLDRYSVLNMAFYKVEWLYEQIDYISIMKGRMDNPHGSKVLSNYYSNFSIPFNHLGRPLYERFRKGDLDGAEAYAENNFSSIYGKVALGMYVPETIPLSPEYIAWCQSNSRTPTGDNLAIGNLVDYDTTQLQARDTIYKNLDDDFIIVIA